MATILEEIERLRTLAANGHGEETIHIVYVQREAAERVKNEKKKTRFIMECDDHGFYSRLNALKDRWFAVANKSVALSVMASLWDRGEEEIKRMCEDVPDEIRRDSDARA
jgi:hypothetical protein